MSGKQNARGWAWYVAPDGKDSNTGASLRGQGRNGPFATLQRARDALRQRRRAEGGLPPGGATVWIAGGDYVLAETLTLTADDAGAPGRPVLWRALDGEAPRLLGGRVLTDLRPVASPSVRKRLTPEARAHVLEADLAAAGIDDCGRLRTRGMGQPVAPAHLELFFGGAPMTVARWPNEGFATLDRPGRLAPDGDGHGREVGAVEGGFHYRADEDRPAGWQSARDAWVHGYWSWDWANTYEAIEHLDLRKRLIRTAEPRGHWGYRAGQRFHYLNVLEELDAPGEYYVDTRRKRLYFWPPRPVAEHEVLASVLETPLVRCDGAAHLRLEGLTLEAGRATGIEILDGSRVTVAGCTLRNLGNHGVDIRGGDRHTVRGCRIHQCGDSGVEVRGGDRPTLTPCRHAVEHNHIHHVTRWTRCYRPAVHASGVGIRIARNLIHDLPHSGIIYWGNEIEISGNHIHHVCAETDDCGAIYTGRDYTTRGNRIRHNLITDIRGIRRLASGIYMDDCVSGQTIEGNVIVRAKVAMHLGGGRDLVVRDNLLVHCEEGINLDARGLSDAPVWHNMVYTIMKPRYEAMRPDQPPYRTAYPELREAAPYLAADGGVPPKLTVERNLAAHGPVYRLHWGATPEHVTASGNVEGVDLGLRPEPGDGWTPAPDGPAGAVGFAPTPWARIGPSRRVLAPPH